MGQLAEVGIECHFSSTGAILQRDGETQVSTTREGRNYVLRPKQGAYEAQSTQYKQYKPDSYKLWHRQMGYIGVGKIQLLQNTTTGIVDLPRGGQGACEICTLSKSVRTVNREMVDGTIRRLERVYTDF